jgi:hypothetical protein
MWCDKLTFLDSISMIKISEISLLPICATIQNKSLVAKFADIAKRDYSLLPVTKIGQVHEKIYAINNLNLIQGCRIANQLVIPSYITQYDTISDVLIAHFHESINEEPLNPLSIFDVIDFLGEKGLNKNLAIEKLWLHNTQYEKIINLKNSHISNKTLEQLQEIVDSLSARNLVPSAIQIPVYIIIKISKISDEDVQLQLVSKISKMVSKIPDGKFAWPTPEQIDILGLLAKDHSETENITNNHNKINNNAKSGINQSKDDLLSFTSQNQAQIRRKNFDSVSKLQQFLKRLENKDNIKLTLTWRYAS